MTSARLLVALAILGSACLFAQDNQKTPFQDNAAGVSNPQSAIAEATPLGIDPFISKRVPEDPLARLEASQPPVFKKYPDHRKVLFIPDATQHGFFISPDLTSNDVTCLKIRSYVMKRDTKDSDSTHLVGYSTCQPARKFQVRTVEGSSEGPSR